MNDSRALDKLYIIGFGPGDSGSMTKRALDIIENAEAVIGSERSSDAFMEVKTYSLSIVIEQVLQFPERNRKKDEKGGYLVVLVSGDSGFYSLTKTLIEHCSGKLDIEVIPGISSIQYLSAKIKVSYDDAVLMSLHGRNEAIVPRVAYNQKVFTLTGGENSVAFICEHLTRFGLGYVQVTVGERLSYPDERITTGNAVDLANSDFNDLSVVYIENKYFADPSLPLRDEDFIRSEVPMTKEEVRWLSVGKMRVEPTDVIYDIGAGTGSVSIELARKASQGFVYAIDSDAEACRLIRENKDKHRAYNLDVTFGEATQVMKWLPVPTKAFIGGSSGKMEAIIRWLVGENPKIRIVTNVVTLQSLSEALRLYEKFGLLDREVVCVNITRNTIAGDYDMLTANNPVFIISGNAGTFRGGSSSQAGQSEDPEEAERLELITERQIALVEGDIRTFMARQAKNSGLLHNMVPAPREARQLFATGPEPLIDKPAGPSEAESDEATANEPGSEDEGL